jgi:hypothetical protein
MKLKAQQIAQIEMRGIKISEVERQLQRFETGMIHIRLNRPAVVGDGIIRLDHLKQKHYISLFSSGIHKNDMVKFVPSSGAATRMFKDLFEFLDDPEVEELSWADLSTPVQTFAENLSKFPFFAELMRKTRNRYSDFNLNLEPTEIQKIVEVLLSPDEMNYGRLPKAMLTFHRYSAFTRFAFEEHLAEASLLFAGTPKPFAIHFTLSPHHLEPFKKLVISKLDFYEEGGKRKFKISYSVQEGSTDTIAADENNKPFTDNDGNLLFRPGGHGALLHNLNLIDADLVFIKNIDNVAVEAVEKKNIEWKKILAGVLIEIQNLIFDYLRQLDGHHPDKPLIMEVIDFISDTFNTHFKAEDPDVVDKLIQFLNRPIRVCGMVLNTGEPGGGPFWVKKDGQVSLQIVESAQINMNDPDQKKIASSATHFNPVDLVCGVRDYKGRKFDLNHFVDPDTSFISVKSHQGNVLKALELPGLWNGAMANWITLFVEVPLLTFNPVKVINDLLRPEHQG